MAARRKNWKFYVYEILDNQNNVIYVGKGVNNRVKQSKRARGGADARIVAMFFDEREAFAHEVERITWYQNLLNSNKGGFGGTASMKKEIPYKKSKDELLMQKIGTRAYAARLLLSLCNTFNYIASKVDNQKLKSIYSDDVIKSFGRIDLKKMSEVAYGCRT